jgi:phosphate uptake regulator
MEIRKLQATGGSSYVISLPKSWVNRCRIGKGDPVGIIVQKDGTLILTPRVTDKEVARIKRFSIEDFDGPIILFRCLIGAYVSGFDYIELQGKGDLPLYVKDVVRRFTKVTIGPEIIEESRGRILLKDLLDPMEMSIGQIIRRMSTIVKGMHEDVVQALITRVENAREIIDDVLKRDDEVDRLYWLTMRQTNMISKNWMMAEKMGISPNESIYYFRIGRIIERIGDHASIIALNSIDLIDKRLDGELLSMIGSASSLSLMIFRGAMDTFFKKDLKGANDNIESIKKLEKACNELNHMILQQKGSLSFMLARIVESIRRTGEYSGDISENVINFLIDVDDPQRS